VELFIFVVHICNVITARKITFVVNSYMLMNFECVLLTWLKMDRVLEITNWRNINQK
jgi:hypothetical protein